jgi:putative MATE family efflux protein
MRTLKTALSLAWKAVKGEPADITGGSIDKAIVMLAVPMILELAMESLFAVVDIFFVSRIGVDAVAVVGLTESMLTIVYSLGFGLAMGITAIVARRIGEKNTPAAAVASVQALYTGLAVSVPVAVAGIFYADELLALMGASPAVREQGAPFTRWMLGGNFVILLLFMINGIFRGAGDAALAMRALWIANGFNLVLDPLFIFGIGPFPELGVKGAAVATNIGRACGVAYQLYHLFFGKGIIKIHRQNWQVRWSVIRDLLKVSAGGTGQFVIASSSWIFLMRIMATFGSGALAAYTIAIRIIIFTILPAWGMSNAAATLVGQNLGAGQPERAERAVWRCGFFNLFFMLLVMALFLLFAESITGFFTTEPEVIRNASLCLRIISLGYILFSYGMILAQAFNGAGDTRTPTVINFFGFWLFQIPLAWFLAIHWLESPSGVFWAIVISESCITVAAAILFKRGKWKEVKV